MSDRVLIGGLSVASPLFRFVEDEGLPGTGIESQAFWAGAEAIIAGLAPRNRELLARRDALQARIDAFHTASPGMPDAAAYRTFLEEIGYLVEEPADFTISTSGVDPEITSLAGPQLVVPLLNARFSLNAANARWGSLYDALYGTDVIPTGGDLAPGSVYNDARGAEVVAYGRRFLDRSVPLATGSHSDAVSYRVDSSGLLIELADGTVTSLLDAAQLVGWTGDAKTPTSFVLVHHGLHAVVELDRSSAIGAKDPAGVKDIVLESALTSIMDLEDSVAAVDAEDKTLGYRNWLGLNAGTLVEAVTKNGATFTRTLNPDRQFSTLGGGTITLNGRALMLVRQVGHLMTTDAVLDSTGAEVPEGILDAIMTGLGYLHGRSDDTALRNSRTGAMYIVKPKMHGPDEVAFTVDIFAEVEKLLGLPALSFKLGIMDEERRTTLNLKACIEKARERVVFINTGFLDRTGDEIHTSLLAGPIVRKGDLKAQRFIKAYEDRNVDIGLAAGFPGRAQIGKGMWAMPNLMAAMMEQKSGHPKSGASTAWVPSPTAATLHALHYHEVDVFDVQKEIASRGKTSVDVVLEIPLAPDPHWTEQDKRDELDNNVQSILGYVVRWVDQGIGCSTVPDIHDIGLMEDRATLRISSQLLANWLFHGIVSEEEVLASLTRIAPVVDAQNAADALYEPLLGGSGIAFAAARDLIILGSQQPNGYTEPLLHLARRAKKAYRAG